MMPNDQSEPVLLDPGVLEILGAVTEILGLAEQFQSIVPTQRMRVKRRHARIEKLQDKCLRLIDDARAGLRILRTAGEGEFDEIPRGVIGVALPATEVEMYRRGLEQLQVAIRDLTKTCYDLEALTQGIPDYASRYFEASEAGRDMLQRIGDAFTEPTYSYNDLIEATERYLARMTNSIRRQLDRKEQD